jgi:group I intron endonuclease
MKNMLENINQKPFGVIYKCTNKINCKVYIGQTKQNLSTRITQHKNQSENNPSTYFHKSLKKYAYENFEWEILKICFSL